VRKIIVATFASLDGVMQAPGGPQEDPTGGFTLARLRGLGLFWRVCPLLINGLAEKVFTTQGYWGRWGRLL